MKKVFSFVTPTHSEEFEGMSFKEVLEAIKGQSGTLYLQMWTDTAIGFIFNSEALIGETDTPLTREDYYNAYDSIY